MKRSIPFHVLVALLPLLALAPVACSDDPGPSSSERWQAVTLPEPDTRVLGLTGVAFDGAHGVVVGYSGQVFDLAVTTRTHAWETRDGGATWTLLPEPGAQNPQPGATACVGPRTLVVGGLKESPEVAHRPVIFESAVGGWNRAALPETPGRLTALARGPNQELRAVGLGSMGLAFVSREAGRWEDEPAGLAPAELPGREVGLTDIAYGGGGWFACGFEGDGMQRDVLLTRGGGGWLRVSTPWGDADIGSLNAVAEAPAGALFVAGQEIDPPTEGHPAVPKAMLKLRALDGSWAEIVLPNAAQLASVNDILVTSTGDVFLACGSEALHLVHAGPGSPATDEGPGSSGRVTALAEGPGGTIWAAGEANGRALLLRRAP